MLVQKLRLKNGWSQEQLAQASGLSVRTIQRIEAGHPASVETLKSLAAVFEVDLATLQQEHTMPSPASIPPITHQTTAEEREKEAFDHVRRLRHFYLHLMRFAVIVALLLAINLLVTPRHLWSLWVIGGWGIGILMHAFSVWRKDWLLGPDWERRQVEKRLGRELW